MLRNGCILLTREQADALAKVVVVEKTGKDGKGHAYGQPRLRRYRDCSVIWRRSGCTSVPRSGAPLPRSRLSIPSFRPS